MAEIMYILCTGFVISKLLKNAQKNPQKQQIRQFFTENAYNGDVLLTDGRTLLVSHPEASAIVTTVNVHMRS